MDLGISHGAQDLIDRILEPSPLKRLSATEALKHPWVLGEGQGRQRLHSAIDAFAAAIEAAKHASDQEATEAALNNNGDEHSTPRRRSTIVANDFINYAAHK